MNAVCDMTRLGQVKFDEAGRQKALDRLEVVDSKKEEPFERIIDLVKTTLGVPICAVSLIDKDRQWFKAFRGLSVDQTPRDIAFCDRAIRADEPFIVEDARNDPRFADNPLVTQDPFIQSYLGIPLKLPDGYIVGTLCIIDQEPRVFSEHEISIVQNFGNLVLGELELRTIASVDGLTKLMSRKAWSDTVEKEVDRATRGVSDLSVLFLDLDHFKKVNDEFGHDVGDLVLRETSAIIGQSLRKHDLFGRLGGEEFAICLIGAPLDVATAVAERIRKKVEELVFPEHPALSCSISIGAAAFEPGQQLKHLLKRSDEALYKAKAQGRNRVATH